MKKSALTVILMFALYYAGQSQSSININAGQVIKYEESPGSKSNDQALKDSRRFREMNVNPVLQSMDHVRLKDTILLDLFSDKHFKAVIEKISTDINGTLNIRAKLAGYKYSYCIISTIGGLSLMTLEIPETKEYYKLKYDHRENKHLLLEIDGAKLEYMEGAPSVIPVVEPEKPDPSKKKNSKNPRYETLQNKLSDADIPVDPIIPDDANNQDIITVMIVYTPAAALWASQNETGISNTVSLLMEKAELALNNSNTLLTLGLVYSGVVSYTELNDVNDLYNLKGTTDGYMDNVHILRDQYSADLVVLLENISYTGGQGYLLSSVAGQPAYGFSLTRVQQASWTYTTIHEIGHNLGCHHHKLQLVQPGPGIFTYSAGWRWTDPDGGYYCSVMTYESGTSFADGIPHTRVPYFSNPDISYLGELTGNTADGDNARTIRETKSVVSDYRTGTTGICGNTEVYSLSSTTANRRAQTITFTEAGTIESISVYHNGGTGRVLLGVYADASGSPGPRLGVTSSTTISSTAGWQTVSLNSPVSVATGQKVWLSWVFETNPGIRYVSGTPARAQSSALWSGGMPDPFGAASFANYKYSVFCTYLPGGTATKTLGNTEVYSLSSTTANRRAQTITFTEAGTIRSISIYHNGGTGQVLLGVYADASGAPGARLGVTPATTISSTAGWQIISLTSSVTVSSGQKVWLSWVFQTNPGVRYISGTPARAQSNALWPGGMPDQFGSSTFANYKYSVYCTYDAGGTGPETKTNGITEVYSLSSATANRRAQTITFTEAGTIQSVSIYHNGGTGQVLLGVYSDASGSPGGQLGVTPATTISSAAGWQTIPLTSPYSIASGQKVWLSWVFQTNPGVRYIAGTPARAQSTALWTGGMPDPFGSATFANYKYSIYCTYITGVEDKIKSASEPQDINSVYPDKEEVLIYPNPTDGDITVTWKTRYSHRLDITIYNILGKAVKEIQTDPDVNEIRLDFDGTSRGIYLFEMKDKKNDLILNRSRIIRN